MKKLHLGCGNKLLRGFVNIDKSVPHDLVSDGFSSLKGNVEDLRGFESDTVDLIYASHVLEHIPRARTFRTLLEWNRVLVPGGVLRVAVPCWEATVEVYRKTGDYENLLNWIYGGAEVETNVHFRQFTFSGLKALLIEAGFKRVTRYDWRQTEHAEVDDFSKAYIPHKDYENGILMSLNVECIKHIYPLKY